MVGLMHSSESCLSSRCVKRPKKGHLSVCEEHGLAGLGVALGTVIGREHVRLHRNNQDGLSVRRWESGCVLVVTDGCSSGRYSEVGAQLGARWLASCASMYLSGGVSEESIGRLNDGLLGYLSGLCGGLCGGGELADVVRDYLLFTYLAVVVSDGKVSVFGQGDGVYSVNGELCVLDSGPDNAPSYLSYGLLEPSVLGGCDVLEARRLHYECGLGELESVMIATDGVLDLLGLEESGPGLVQLEDPRFLRNPSLLQKRLVVLGERRKYLRDDTTVALLRRREGEGDVGTN